MFTRRFLRAAGPSQLRRNAGIQKATRGMSLFTASIGVSFCPKRRSNTPSHKDDTGEDAFFLAPTDRATWLGVLDGVGGWADMGVDPSVFSKGLAKHLAREAQSATTPSPMEVLRRGYTALLADSSVLLGSSTACIASVDLSDGVLRVAKYVLYRIDFGLRMSQFR